jgi:hypothetical protein
MGQLFSSPGGGFVMKSSALFLVFFFVSASLVWAQKGLFTPPPTQSGLWKPVPGQEFEIAKAQGEKPLPAPLQRLGSADLEKLKRDAAELASLAQSIPPDVDQTTKGILPQDLDKKLKTIEKLSKQLRSRISP